MTTTARAAHEIALEPATSALAELATLDRVVLSGVPLPGGSEVALRLDRVPLHLAPGAIHVDGSAAPHGLDPSLSLWSGSVVGQPDSQAFMAFSRHGSRGWFGRPGRFQHLLAEPGPRGDWSRSRLVTEGLLQAAGSRRNLGCQMLTPPGQPLPTPPAGGVGPTAGGPPLPYYDAPIAFETDYEFYQLFNDLKAAQAYAFALIGAVSDRYREQVGVIFTLPYVGFHTTNNDRWTSNDCFTRLSEFRTAWRNGQAPVRAELYHMISGVRVSGCGGVAYLNVICNQSAGFGMSAHINARLTFPPVPGPLTWDFFVLAHELGHQFGTRHTHDYTPKIDNCAGGSCISNGTNMSYCHTCFGGMRNITLRFHPRVVATMRTAVVNSCLQRFDGVIADELGFALAGSNGTPAQTVSYSKPTVRIDVVRAPKSRPGVMVFGSSKALLPFLGGTLVPSPDLPIPIAATSSGDASLSFPAHGSFQSGLIFYVHSWFLDPGGPNAFAASNGTQVELIRP